MFESLPRGGESNQPPVAPLVHVLREGDVEVESCSATVGYFVPDRHRAAAQELFQLLKVPAEPFREEGQYDVVIADGEPPKSTSAGRVLVYGSRPLAIDARLALEVRPSRANAIDVRVGDIPWSLPVRTGLATVSGAGEPLLWAPGLPVAMSVVEPSGRRIDRIGYSLLAEVERLLMIGQPEQDAGVPTLDLQLRLLRERLASAAPLVEVPPVPNGYGLVVTLSHDIDHLSLAEGGLGLRWLSVMRQSTLWPLHSWLHHGWPFGSALGSWRFALCSPLICLRIMPDPWRCIEAYVEVENQAGAQSTYFFIPFKGRKGANSHQRSLQPRRAANYELDDERDLLRRLVSAGRELAVHGIDAWRDSTLGRAEKEKLAEVSGVQPRGTRMHYLYFEPASFARLEDAGFDYDSTVGFPRRTGFRAGTLQPYRPLTARRLLEMPLHLEDGGLLSVVGEDCSPKEAALRVEGYLDLAELFGGSLNCSWHDHSLGPPRYWQAPYQHLLGSARRRGAWIVSMGQAFEWFRRRRGIQVGVVSHSAHSIKVEVKMEEAWPDQLPRPRLRVHLPGTVGSPAPARDFLLKDGLQELPLFPGAVPFTRD